MSRRQRQTAPCEKFMPTRFEPSRHEFLRLFFADSAYVLVFLALTVENLWKLVPGRDQLCPDELSRRSWLDCVLDQYLRQPARQPADLSRDLVSSFKFKVLSF
jgi:hypothetical protein